MPRRGPADRKAQGPRRLDPLGGEVHEGAAGGREQQLRPSDLGLEIKERPEVSEPGELLEKPPLPCTPHMFVNKAQCLFTPEQPGVTPQDTPSWGVHARADADTGDSARGRTEVPSPDFSPSLN